MVHRLGRLIDSPSFRLTASFILFTKTSRCKRFCPHVMRRLGWDSLLLSQARREKQGREGACKGRIEEIHFECGRTFGVLQYDQESPLKNVATSVCAELGGLSFRAAPKAHLQSSGSVGQLQCALFGQLRTLFIGLRRTRGEPLIARVQCTRGQSSMPSGC